MPPAEAASAATVAPNGATTAPNGATAVDTCTPDASTGCISGTIRTSGGEPAEGVVVEINGPGGSTEATTDATGRWTVAVTAPGQYTVEVDVTTLPAGETLRDPANNPRTVTVALGSSTGALFPLGTPRQAAPAAGGTTPGADEAPAGGGEAGETGVSPEVAAAAGSSTGQRAFQLFVSGLIFGLLLALASVGLSLIYGTTGLSNFAHGEMVTLGALIAYWGFRNLGLSLVAAGALAVAVGLIAGYAQDRGIWGPLRRMRTGLTQQLIVTIGSSLALQYLFNMLAGGNSLRIITSNPQIVHVGPLSFTAQTAISVLIAIVVLAGVAFFLTRTRIGRATRAVSDNPALASASGIDVDRIVRTVWAMSGGLAALGGVLLGLYLSATRWNMGTTLLLLMFAAVTLGGLGTAFGALAGSLVIGVVVEMSTLVIPSDMRYAAALLVLILVLLLRPQGILGHAERIG
jgi:branched-chain amino acid transport system permease protein